MIAELSAAEALRRNPYRLFFPVGIMAGLFGVGDWVAWTLGVPVNNVKLLHLTLQSQGFLAFFVVGFLLTAFPRFSGTDSAEISEIVVSFLGGLGFLTGELLRNWRISQIGFLVMIGVIPVFAGRRVIRHTKELPPSFLLLGFGFLNAILGALFSLGSNMGETHFALFAVGRQMVQLGFLLCIVLGITAKLTPFLMGYTAEPDRGDGGPAGILSRPQEILIHGLTGALLTASFLMEPMAPRAANGLRAAVSTAHLLWFAKIGRPLIKKTATIFFFWVACWMIPLGFWLAFLLPAYRVASLHVVFIGGFSLMIFSFGMLIVLSHSGRAALLNGKLWTLKTVGVLTLLALAFRLAADFLPNQYMVLLHSASGFWVVAAGVWLGYAAIHWKQRRS